MRTVKITAILSVGVLLLVTRVGFAQDMQDLAKVPPGVRAKVQTEFMKEKLKLSPEQLGQVEAINVKYADKMQGVLTGSSGFLMKMRDAKGLDQAKDGELQKVLNPEQYQGYLASKNEMKERMMAKLKEKAAAQ